MTFELALLQAELGEDKVDGAAAVNRLSMMDATMMGALEAVPDIVDQLEKAAERDEQYEPAFVHGDRGGGRHAAGARESASRDAADCLTLGAAGSRATRCA